MKRNTRTAREFEYDMESNLVTLFDELAAGTYRPGPSICFIVTRPKPREVWAAGFRDRVVHHLLYNKVGPRFERAFVADSCACIKGRGTLYAVQRLESKVRAISANWSRRAWYLKADVANFFVAIDKPILAGLLASRISEPWWWRLTEIVLMHDPRPDVVLRCPESKLSLVPAHKRLGLQPAHRGLPIGNLSSQFFANVYLNELDQFVKHRLRARHYVRYVDDFILLHESRDWLADAERAIGAFLEERLALRLNPKKTILQPVERGVDFVGQVVKPWRRETRRKTVGEALRQVARAGELELPVIANSYFGLLGQASANHGDRALVAKAVLRHGVPVTRDLRKVASNG
jgi:retron-type reverse transcriptase